jgi:hypothetical protein
MLNAMGRVILGPVKRANSIHMYREHGTKDCHPMSDEAQSLQEQRDTIDYALGCEVLIERGL